MITFVAKCFFKMKNTIRIILAVIFLGSTLPLTAQTFSDPVAKKYQTKGAPLPQLEIKTLDNKTLTNKDLKTEGHLFLVVFNPTCDGCIKMAQQMLKNTNYFTKSKVVFLVQPKVKAYIPEFLEKTELDKYPDFILGIDNNYSIDKIANYGSLPMINIYDKNQKLVETFNGFTPLPYLTKFLP